MGVKLRPPAPTGRFYPYDWWQRTLGNATRLTAAERDGALRMEPRGPRGGKWYAVTSLDAWEDFVRAFNERCRKQVIGRLAARVERAILRG